MPAPKSSLLTLGIFLLRRLPSAVLFHKCRLHCVERLGQVTGQAFEKFDLPVVDVVEAETKSLLKSIGKGDGRGIVARDAADAAQQLHRCKNFGHTHNPQITIFGNEAQRGSGITHRRGRRGVRPITQLRVLQLHVDNLQFAVENVERLFYER